MSVRESGKMFECKSTVLVISNWQLSRCSPTGLVIGNMKVGPFRSHRGRYNSFVGRERVPTNTSRDVCHSNCGETTLKNTRCSNAAKWNLALEKLFEFRLFLSLNTLNKFSI